MLKVGAEKILQSIEGNETNRLCCRSFQQASSRRQQRWQQGWLVIFIKNILSLNLTLATISSITFQKQSIPLFSQKSAVGLRPARGFAAGVAGVGGQRQKAAFPPHLNGKRRRQKPRAHVFLASGDYLDTLKLPRLIFFNAVKHCEF